MRVYKQVELLQDICRETSATRRGASLHVSRVGRKHFVNGRFYRMGRDSALHVWKRMEEAVESSGIGFSKPALMECVGGWLFSDSCELLLPSNNDRDVLRVCLSAPGTRS